MNNLTMFILIVLYLTFSSVYDTFQIKQSIQTVCAGVER